MFQLISTDWNRKYCHCPETCTAFLFFLCFLTCCFHTYFLGKPSLIYTIVLKQWHSHQIMMSKWHQVHNYFIIHISLCLCSVCVIILPKMLFAPLCPPMDVHNINNINCNLWFWFILHLAIISIFFFPFLIFLSWNRGIFNSLFLCLSDTEQEQWIWCSYLGCLEGQILDYL